MNILFSNIGYARGINGCIDQHIKLAHRHIYCPADAQVKILSQLNKIILDEDPDICCFVEIDKGSFPDGKFSQLKTILNEKYRYFDIENKYGQSSWLRKLPMTKGKSNAFISKHDFPYEKIYFYKGTKKLIYKVKLRDDLTLFFSHFSLSKKVREFQLFEIKKLIASQTGDVIFLGDFNILSGLDELSPLLLEDDLVLLNDKQHPTFTFHKRSLLLDLCICSKNIAKDMSIKIIPQPYSDHAALLVSLKNL